MTKLSTAQTAHLDHALAAHLDRVKSQKTEREIAIRAADERIANKMHEEDRAIRKARDAGVPKDRIRRHLGIGHMTLEEALQRTAELDLAPEVEEVSRFEWADDEQARVRITLAGSEWDARLAEMQPKLRKHHDANSAEYRIVDGEFIARSDMYDRTTENAYDHPVTAWLLYSGGLSEVQAWISAQGEGIAA